MLGPTSHIRIAEESHLMPKTVESNWEGAQRLSKSLERFGFRTPTPAKRNANESVNWRSRENGGQFPAYGTLTQPKGTPMGLPQGRLWSPIQPLLVVSSSLGMDDTYSSGHGHSGERTRKSMDGITPKTWMSLGLV